MENTEKTAGEKIVRTSFNVAEGKTHTEVDIIKNQFAEMINDAEKMATRDPRLAAIVKTKLEETAMWYVKLATA